MLKAIHVPLVEYYYGELFHLPPTILLYGSTYLASVVSRSPEVWIRTYQIQKRRGKVIEST